MPLVDLQDIKTTLTQIGASTDYDALLNDIIEDVEDIITLYLGFAFDEGYTDETDVVVYGSGTPWLTLPPHQYDSITAVVVEGSTSELTGYAEETDGSALYFTGYTPYGGYGWGVRRYVITANWGYGDWPQAVKRVAKELVANIFTESKTGHFSDIQGVQGAGGDVAVGYAGALTKRQKMILDGIKRKYRPLVVA